MGLVVTKEIKKEMNTENANQPSRKAEAFHIAKEEKDRVVLLMISNGSEQESIRERLRQEIETEDKALVDTISCVLSSGNPRRQLEHCLDRSIARVRAEYAELYISDSRPFLRPENVGLLTRLQDDGTPFKFCDFPAIERKKGDALKFLIEVLKRQREELEARNQNIASRLKAKREEGVKLGNPKIKDKQTQINAARQKKRQVFFDQVSWRDFPIIAELYYRWNYSKNKIAQELNNRGYTTRYGKPFHAKTVERLLENMKSLQNSFTPHPGAINRLSAIRNHDLAQASSQKKFRFEDIKDTDNRFSDHIFIKFREPVITSLQMAVYDNAERKVFEKTFAPGVREINVDVFNDTYLFPGWHFIRFEADGYATKEVEAYINYKIYDSVAQFV